MQWISAEREILEIELVGELRSVKSYHYVTDVDDPETDAVMLNMREPFVENWSEDENLEIHAEYF